MNERNPQFIAEADIVNTHRETITRYGGIHGIRDLSLLQSALGAVESHWYYQEDCDIYDLAATYCSRIALNHPFYDGNKRTSLDTAFLFLSINGLDPTNRRLESANPNPDTTDEMLAQSVNSVIEGQLSESDFALALFRTVALSPVLPFFDRRISAMVSTLGSRRFRSSEEYTGFLVDLILSETTMIFIEVCETFWIRGDRFGPLVPHFQEMVTRQVSERYQAEKGR